MKKLIGYLMHLANSERVKEPWYTLKQMLAERYGSHNGYDIQYLPGTECYACDGTGSYKKYTYRGYVEEPCYKCDNGWYRKPAYVLLQRISVGGYVFHKPIRREYKLITLDQVDIPASVTIEGYIWHDKKRGGWLAFMLLFMLFSRKEYVRYIKTWGTGWRVSWWLPENWVHNYMHVKKQRWGSVPSRKLKEWWTKRKRRPETILTDEFPF